MSYYDYLFHIYRLLIHYIMQYYFWRCSSWAEPARELILSRAYFYSSLSRQAELGHLTSHTELSQAWLSSFPALHVTHLVCLGILLFYPSYELNVQAYLQIYMRDSSKALRKN
jgi:hypothetical protein